MVEDVAGAVGWNTYLWLIQVAWAFSQHGGWVHRTSIPRGERETEREAEKERE